MVKWRCFLSLHFSWEESRATKKGSVKQAAAAAAAPGEAQATATAAAAAPAAAAAAASDDDEDVDIFDFGIVFISFNLNDNHPFYSHRDAFHSFVHNTFDILATLTHFLFCFWLCKLGLALVFGLINCTLCSNPSNNWFKIPMQKILV